MNRRRLLALAIATVAPTAGAQTPPEGLQTHQFLGAVGPYRIGMSLTYRNSVTFIEGHYFYATRLKDIPLTGAMSGETLTVREPGGGLFRLRLVTNESTKTRPLTIYTSTGFVGDWTGQGRTLPVTVHMTTVYDGPAKRRLYGDVTDESDAAFEARVRRFISAALKNERKAAAAEVSYPLRVNGRRTLRIRGPAELVANWDRIFTPYVIDALRTAVPHEMLTRYDGAMVANGVVWFDARGASAINLGDK